MDIPFDLTLAAIAVIGSLTFGSHQQRKLDHDEAVLEHEKFMKFGSVPVVLPKDGKEPKSTHARDCQVCGVEFETWQLTWYSAICRQKAVTEHLQRAQNGA